MRLRNIPGADEAIADSPHCIQEPMAEKGRWNLIFGNDHPVHIEIGMGKGQFIMQFAKDHPDINYIGIERYSSVLLRALQKMEVEPLPNIRFLCMDASMITEVFDKEEVAKIYLNFSDPWPKERHAKRRKQDRCAAKAQRHHVQQRHPCRREDPIEQPQKAPANSCRNDVYISNRFFHCFPLVPPARC